MTDSTPVQSLVAAISREGSVWYAGVVHAGFALPNGGRIEGGLDLNEYLVRHPHHTFVYQVEGDSMSEAGILCGDFVLVDRTLTASDGQIIVGHLDGTFIIRELSWGAQPMLISHHPGYAPLLLDEHSEFSVIGPVIAVLRCYH